MLDKEILSFRVNGVPRQAAVRANQTLLEALREDLGLTGTKEGCDDASCGACTVLLDGKPVISCAHLALLVEGADVTTIEGAARDGGLAAVQDAMIEMGGLQCGYCTPGMVLAAHALLDGSARGEGQRATRRPLDRDAIREGLSNNLCRCTGYERIASAVELAASRLSPGDPPGLPDA
jgi:carbon-monoxide dehydrogenase small subunit